MTLDSYYISRKEIRVFPQVALLSRIKSPKTSQNHEAINNSQIAVIENQGTLTICESAEKT